MTVAILRDPEAVEALEGEWERLFDTDPRATPFSHPGWARAWLRHFGDAAAPFVITVRTEGRLVGLAPLVVVRRAGLRIMRVLGKEPADYWDVLAAPADREQVTEAVLSSLRDHRAAWDLLVLDALPPSSPTPAAFEAEAGMRLRRRQSRPCPGIELPSDLEEYLASLSRNRRSKVRRYLRRVDEGLIEVREVTAISELPDAIDRWHALRLAQWDSDPERQMLALQRTDRFRGFLRDVTRELVPAGLAELREMRAEGRLVGSYLSFCDSRSYYHWLGGFSPSAATLALGFVDVSLAIRSSIERGRGYFDFLVGAEPYKHWYGAVDRLMTPLVIGNSRLASRAALGASALWDRRRGA